MKHSSTIRIRLEHRSQDRTLTDRRILPANRVNGLATLREYTGRLAFSLRNNPGEVGQNVRSVTRERRYTAPMADSLFLSLIAYLRIDEIPFTDYEGDRTESKREEATKKKGTVMEEKRGREKGRAKSTMC